MYFRKRTTLQTLQIRITMKRNILLLIILTVISLEASGQKYTIYVDDFNSEIKIPNRAINLIRLAFIDGIRNTNRINVVDAVSAGSDLSLSPLEDAGIPYQENHHQDGDDDADGGIQYRFLLGGLLLFELSPLFLRHGPLGVGLALSSFSGCAHLFASVLSSMFLLSAG